MKRESYKYLTKKELRRANRLAIDARGTAIEPDYVRKLPTECKYPVFFSLPCERGWMRCQVGTSVSGTGNAFVPLWLDVPPEIYESLGTVKIEVDDEVAEV